MCATSFRFKLYALERIIIILLTIVISSWSLILTGLSPSLAALNKQEGFNRENPTGQIIFVKRSETEYCFIKRERKLNSNFIEITSNINLNSDLHVSLEDTTLHFGRRGEFCFLWEERTFIW